jgi:hypothetical protein
MDTSENLSVKQEKLIAHLLVESTIDAACKKANVAVTTYWRWMRDQNFVDAYRWARNEILENTVARLQTLNAAAVQALERNLNCNNPSIEIRCATVILDLSMKATEMLNLKKRVEYLETLVESMEVDHEPIKTPR